MSLKHVFKISLVSLVLFTFSCKKIKSDEKNFFPFSFNKSKWKEDSLACNGYRQSIIDSIVINKYFFVHKKNCDSVLFYLDGYRYIEESTSKIHYYYWRRAGYHCHVDLTKRGEYEKAISSEPFFAIIADKRNRTISDIIYATP
jgi:hypothetical protein